MPEFPTPVLLAIAADCAATGALRVEESEHSDWIAADRGDFTVVHETHQRTIRVYRGTRLLREFPISYAAGHEGQARMIAEAMVRRVANHGQPRLMEGA